MSRAPTPDAFPSDLPLPDSDSEPTMSRPCSQQSIRSEDDGNNGVELTGGESEKLLPDVDQKPECEPKKSSEELPGTFESFEPIPAPKRSEGKGPAVESEPARKPRFTAEDLLKAAGETSAQYQCGDVETELRDEGFPEGKTATSACFCRIDPLHPLALPSVMIGSIQESELKSIFGAALTRKTESAALGRINDTKNAKPVNRIDCNISVEELPSHGSTVVIRPEIHFETKTMEGNKLKRTPNFVSVQMHFNRHNVLNGFSDVVVNEENFAQFEPRFPFIRQELNKEKSKVYVPPQFADKADKAKEEGKTYKPFIRDLHVVTFTYTAKFFGRGLLVDAHVGNPDDPTFEIVKSLMDVPCCISVLYVDSRLELPLANLSMEFASPDPLREWFPPTKQLLRKVRFQYGQTTSPEERPQYQLPQRTNFVSFLEYKIIQAYGGLQEHEVATPKAEYLPAEVAIIRMSGLGNFQYFGLLKHANEDIRYLADEKLMIRFDPADTSIGNAFSARVILTPPAILPFNYTAIQIFRPWDATKLEAHPLDLATMFSDKFSSEDDFPSTKSLADLPSTITELDSIEFCNVTVAATVSSNMVRQQFVTIQKLDQPSHYVNEQLVLGAAPRAKRPNFLRTDDELPEEDADADDHLSDDGDGGFEDALSSNEPNAEPADPVENAEDALSFNEPNAEPEEAIELIPDVFSDSQITIVQLPDDLVRMILANDLRNFPPRDLYATLRSDPVNLGKILDWCHDLMNEGQKNVQARARGAEAGVLMVQGAAGTGKTRTICCLVGPLIFWMEEYGQDVPIHAAKPDILYRSEEDKPATARPALSGDTMKARKHQALIITPDNGTADDLSMRLMEFTTNMFEENGLRNRVPIGFRLLNPAIETLIFMHEADINQPCKGPPIEGESWEPGEGGQHIEDAWAQHESFIIPRLKQRRIKVPELSVGRFAQQVLGVRTWQGIKPAWVDAEFAARYDSLRAYWQRVADGDALKDKEKIAMNKDWKKLFNELLARADFICCTTYVANLPRIWKMIWPTVIITDESSRMAERDFLGILTSYFCLPDLQPHLILFGDVHQLPPQAQASQKTSNFFHAMQTSFMARLYRAGFPISKLVRNERSVADIIEIGKIFYRDELTLSPQMLGHAVARNHAQKLKELFGLQSHQRNVLFINASTSDAQAIDHSPINCDSLKVAMEVISILHRDMNVPMSQILHLMPYVSQLKLAKQMAATLRSNLEKEMKKPVDIVKLYQSTIDAIQGREREFVVFDLTNTHRLGFMKHSQRLIVPHTRAQLVLIIIANMNTLESSKACSYGSIFGRVYDRCKALKCTVNWDAAKIFSLPDCHIRLPDNVVSERSLTDDQIAKAEELPATAAGAGATFTDAVAGASGTAGLGNGWSAEESDGFAAFPDDQNANDDLKSTFAWDTTATGAPTSDFAWDAATTGAPASAFGWDGTTTKAPTSELTVGFGIGAEQSGSFIPDESHDSQWDSVRKSNASKKNKGSSAPVKTDEDGWVIQSPDEDEPCAGSSGNW